MKKLRLERFPGEILPDLSTQEKLPLPEKVGEYGTRDQFIASPKWPAQWVHWRRRADLVLQGKYEDVHPLHFEGIFTLACNFMCPHCDQRTARENWISGGTWQPQVKISSENTMNLTDLKQVISKVADFKMDDYMGIVWGGGEPSLIPDVYDALTYSRKMGLCNSFLTNGVFVDVEALAEAAPTLVRFSLNCGSENLHATFHGYPSNLNYFKMVLNNIEKLARLKKENNLDILLGVSLIVDERNLSDLISAANLVRSIAQAVEQDYTELSPIDYVIVRPVLNYAHFKKKHAVIKKDTKQKALKLVNNNIKAILGQVGIPVIPIKDSFDAAPPSEFYDRCECLAYGWCGQILPAGGVQLCSDSYSNPEYTIGNILGDNLFDIWKSAKRRDVIQKNGKLKCYMKTCPFNSRGHSLNRIFHQIERKRREGHIDDVTRWVDDLRLVTIPPKHSFFI